MLRVYLSIVLTIGTLLSLSIGESLSHKFSRYFAAPTLQPHFTNSPLIDFSPEPLTISTSPPQTSIPELLEESQVYHQQLVLVRGLITQPELHLDETELYLDFVFRLNQGPHSIIVYGRHDRTQGPPAISMNQTVEVIGRFFKKQERNNTTLFNVLHAIAVTPFPSSIPDNT